jgi:hypothetical protein
MAAVEVNVGSAVVKLRRPWVVGALSLIPFYWVFWYYAVNREMRDFGGARGDEDLGETRPWLSVIAVTIGALAIVPPIVSEWRAVQRIGACESLAGGPRGKSVLTLGLLVGAWLAGLAVGVISAPLAMIAAFCGWVVAFVGATVLMQRRLTRLWTEG